MDFGQILGKETHMTVRGEISKHLHFGDCKNELAKNSLQFAQWGKSVRVKVPHKELPVRDTFVPPPFN